MILKLDEILKAKKVSGKTLAVDLELTPGYISDIRTHKKTPSIETLTQIADYLDVDIKELFISTKKGSSTPEELIAEIEEKLNELKIKIKINE